MNNIGRIRNIGNSCYLNAMLQALCSIPFLLWELDVALKPQLYDFVKTFYELDDETKAEELAALRANIEEKKDRDVSLSETR